MSSSRKSSDDFKDEFYLEWSKLNAWTDSFNLSKRYPAYFNKWAFRACFIVGILYFALVLYMNDWNYNFAYAECPVDPSRQYMPCDNPFYSSDCESGICMQEFILQGETIGIKPDVWARSFGLVFTVLALFGFVVNHALYMLRGNRDAS